MNKILILHSPSTLFDSTAINLNIVIKDVTEKGYVFLDKHLPC